MKKFLTVLLVIAVMFTFSFGSAFAASVDDQINAKVAEEQIEMAKKVNEYAAKFIYNQAGKLVTIPDLDANTQADGNVTKDVVDATFEVIISDYNEKIEAEGLKQQEKGKYSASALENAWVGADTVTTFVSYCGKDGVLYTKAIEAAEADLEAAIAAVDLDVYADADQTKIKNAIATAENTIETATVDRTGLAALVAAEKALEDLLDGLKTVEVQEEELAKAKEDALEAIADYAADFKAAEAERLEKIIEDKQNPAWVAEATTKLENLDANVAAVEAIYVAKVEAAEMDENTSLSAAKSAVSKAKSAAKTAFATKDAFYTAVGEVSNVDILVAYAETLADTLKNKYSEKTGLATYNEATVDKYLAKTIKSIEALELRTYDAVAKAMAKVPTAEAEAEALEDAAGAAVSAITTGKYAATKWDGENKEAVEAIQEEYEALIKVAATADEIEELEKAAKEAMDAYLRTADAAALVERLDSVLDSYEAALKAYAEGIVGKDVTGKYTQGQVTDAVADAREILEDAITATQDKNLTAKEAKAVCEANYDAALAVIDAMQDDAALKAEKEAVEAAINALDKTPTLDNKADYLAVKDMVEAYNELAGAKALSNASKLTGYLNKIERLEKEAVEALVKALPTVITVADKAAVEAADAANDAFMDEYDAKISTTYQNKLTNAKADLASALKLDAAKKIAALPADITLADKAAVEAAKAAYDALDEASKKVFDNASSALVKKLEAAVAEIADLAVETVEAVKITAKSSAKKGSITVKWTVEGDTTGVEAYEIWKSTQHSKGYKKAFTTTKMSYKNTKELKKGTRYYYKVRAIAYDAEGNKIKSDWSNKARRIAK